MGHGHVKPHCEFFLKRLYAKGKLSIRECAQAMKDAGMKYLASEGEYDEPWMLEWAVSDIVGYYLDYREVTINGVQHSVIEPVTPLKKEQAEMLEQWLDHCFPADEEGAHEAFDTIQWKFSKGWRKRFKDIPLLENVTH